VDIPRLSDSEIRQAARELTTECFGTKASYPIDLDAIVYEHLYSRDSLRFSDEEDLGADETGDDILGKMTPRAGRVLVTSRLQGEFNRGRFRFTVGHEVGHWMLHRPYILASLDEPALFGGPRAEEEPLVSYRRTIFPIGPSSTVSRQEYQANRFSIALLVDPAALRGNVEERFGECALYRQRAAADLRGGDLHQFSVAIGSARRKGLPPLTEVFGVSKQAMAIALREYGFVSEVEPLL
jgi:hypothetical protein